MDHLNGLSIYRHSKTSNGGQASEREAVLSCRVWRDNELKVCGVTSKLKAVCWVTFCTSCMYKPLGLNNVRGYPVKIALFCGNVT
jgi:hypothetical protein